MGSLRNGAAAARVVVQLVNEAKYKEKSDQSADPFSPGEINV
jgi:hypothetical protein